MLTNKPSAATGHAEDLMSRFAVPFAKALAVFLREAGIEHRAPPSDPVAQNPEEFTELNDKLAVEAVTTRIRRLMRERAISQAALAARASLSLGVVSRALRDPSRAKLSTLRRIATALDARFTELL